jgi:hypothetical protein
LLSFDYLDLLEDKSDKMSSTFFRESLFSESIDFSFKASSYENIFLSNYLEELLFLIYNYGRKLIIYYYYYGAKPDLLFNN